jgi:hypothetical protein
LKAAQDVDEWAGWTYLARNGKWSWRLTKGRGVVFAAGSGYSTEREAWDVMHAKLLACALSAG